MGEFIIERLFIMGGIFPVFFILFVIFVIWLNYERVKSSRLDEERKKQFWNRENDANSVRRKSLDDLNYIKIPEWLLLSELSPSLPKDDPELLRCSDVFSSLKNQRIFNLTGLTSTDIKMEYGPANLAILDEYDQNFTLFAQTIYAYGDRLNTLGFDMEAIKVLRFGIDSLSDISGNYKLLATLYVKYGQTEKIGELKETAQKLNSLMKNSILRHLDNIESENRNTQ